MSFYSSLFVYNPLEAFILFYFCYTLSGINLSIRIIKDCYILGSINLIFQYASMFINNSMISCIYDIFVSIFVMYFILLIYLNIVCKNKISRFTIFGSCIFNFISIFICIFIFNEHEFMNYNSLGCDNIQIETIFNCSLRLIQFFILYLFFKGEIFYEKITKKYCN